MQALTFQATSPAPRDVWMNIYKSSPDALVSQSPAWLDCVCEITGYTDASRLYETEYGEYLVLPMVRRKLGPIKLPIEASFPNSWGFGGLLASNSIQAKDIASVLDDLARQPTLQIGIRPNPLTAEVWATAAMGQSNVISLPRLAHVVDLADGFEQIWTKRFDSNTRGRIRKAERLGLVVECDTSGRLVPIFYDLFLDSLDRWAGQQHEPAPLARWRGQQRDSLRKFQILAERLGQACQIWVAWHQGQPAAAILILQGANAHYTRGVMNKGLAGPTCANYLLQKLAIEDACRVGCRFYHMGESGTSGSLAEFKSHFGAVAHPYAEYRIERFPITRIDAGLRQIIKKAIGFKDV